MFVSNVHRGAGGDGKDILGGGASKGEINNINKDGHYNMLGRCSGSTVG